MADIVSPEKRSQNMSAIRSKNTKPEVYLRKLLFAQGYRYRIAGKSVPGHPDIFLRKYNTAIFVNGCFWHRHPGCKYAYTPKSRVEFWQKKFDDNVRRDSAVKAELLEHGIKCLIVWECTIKRMQKDTIIHSITSVMLDPTNMNIPVTIGDITSVAVNGQELGFGGYLDIGLYDTMEDLFVNFIGALVFSFIGYFYIKRRGEGKIAKAFIPTITEPKPEEGPAEVPATPTTEEE